MEAQVDTQEHFTTQLSVPLSQTQPVDFSCIYLDSYVWRDCSTIIKCRSFYLHLHVKGILQVFQCNTIETYQARWMRIFPTFFFLQAQEDTLGLVQVLINSIQFYISSVNLHTCIGLRLRTANNNNVRTRT